MATQEGWIILDMIQVLSLCCNMVVKGTSSDQIVVKLTAVHHPV